MKLTLPIGAVLVLFVTSSCGRPTCDSTRVCMRNNTFDTVYYAWNSNFFDKILPPGESACLDLGQKERTETVNVLFESDQGSYALEVDECSENFTID